MRTLIFGAGGQIGAHLVAAADRREHAVLGTWYRRPLQDFAPVDLLDDEAVRDAVNDFEPDTIHLAAGLSRIDYAETHPEECEALARDGTANVLNAAATVDARVVLYSSEQAIGECPHPAKEELDGEPLSVYGRCQRLMEDMVSATPRHLIVRTSQVYGPHELPRNAALHVIRRLRDGHTLTAANDRMVQPTYGPDLAECVMELLDRGTSGIVHLVGSERLTEYAFMKQIAFIFGFDSDMVEPVPAAALCEEAPRPLTAWLGRDRLRAMMGTRAIRTLSEGLRTLKTPLRIAA